jgi:hypothetical protein
MDAFGFRIPCKGRPLGAHPGYVAREVILPRPMGADGAQAGRGGVQRIGMPRDKIPVAVKRHREHLGHHDSRSVFGVPNEREHVQCKREANHSLHAHRERKLIAKGLCINLSSGIVCRRFKRRLEEVCSEPEFQSTPPAQGATARSCDVITWSGCEPCPPGTMSYCLRTSLVTAGDWERSTFFGGMDASLHAERVTRLNGT